MQPDAIMEIREQWHQRQAWHRAEKSLTLQAKALCRRLAGGDKLAAEKLFRAALGKGEHPSASIAAAAMAPLIDGRDQIEKARTAIEKRLCTLAEQLPIASKIKEIRGFGALSLAAIIGEAGDLSKYPKKGHLWKRMGLALMPDGTRQRRIAGEEAIEHGYSPRRRSVMWTIGDCLVKQGRDYRQVYLDRKAYEIARAPDIRPVIAHRRAQRYMEKRLLRDLWQAWREAEGAESEKAITTMPRAPFKDAA